MKLNILKTDPTLMPYKDAFLYRAKAYERKLNELLADNKSLMDFANGYEYFGIHKTDKGWVYREWAPGADEMYFTGDFANWDCYAYPMKRIKNGVFEIYLEGDNTLSVGQKVQAIIIRNGEFMRRVPAYATRVVQDERTYEWCAEVDDILFDGFKWTDDSFTPAKTPFIYECHIGMAQEEGRVGTFGEFTERILPRIKRLGYNTIQIMAIMEHPYYGSFGYQVSNFFAVSSRYGYARDLKTLINRAHEMGITVLLDVVHSHAVKNGGEGLNYFDGTHYQYFHEGTRGYHTAWDTKLFNYDKNEVLHFLLSNLKYWMEIFHFDGFRFDGVTSMLYHDHGLGSAFTDYSMYFSENTDTEAVTYLMLANTLIREVNERAITIAEDMSGMPGMCIPIKDGGIGFDYRLSMGIPDLWIKFIKEYSDENWDMFMLWYELTSRRKKEKAICYCESHDQALVGDKTIIFRLCDSEMYWSMAKDRQSPIIDRGIALHKMLRLITATTAGEGYLNFMGNEFGHPEWIDFPREGNGWSYHYCRRQWSLSENELLKYKGLNEFDRAMIKFLKKERIMTKSPQSQWIDQADKVIIYSKRKVVFAFNFHPEKSFENYFVPVEAEGFYKIILSTDEDKFGGFCRTDSEFIYKAEKTKDGRIGFFAYLPNRCGIVFKGI